MKNKLSLRLLVASVVVSALSACAVGPGDKADAVPPRIVVDSGNRPSWDRGDAFGPVPANLQARGDGICKDDGFKKATGYHPNAIRLDGKPFKGGGYYCVDDRK